MSDYQALFNDDSDAITETTEDEENPEENDKGKPPNSKNKGRTPNLLTGDPSQSNDTKKRKTKQQTTTNKNEPEYELKLKKHTNQQKRARKQGYDNAKDVWSESQVMLYPKWHGYFNLLEEFLKTTWDTELQKSNQGALSAKATKWTTVNYYPATGSFQITDGRSPTTLHKVASTLQNWLQDNDTEDPDWNDNPKILAKLSGYIKFRKIRIFVDQPKEPETNNSTTIPMTIALIPSGTSPKQKYTTPTKSMTSEIHPMYQEEFNKAYGKKLSPLTHHEDRGLWDIRKQHLPIIYATIVDNIHKNGKFPGYKEWLDDYTKKHLKNQATEGKKWFTNNIPKVLSKAIKIYEHLASTNHDPATLAESKMDAAQKNEEVTTSTIQQLTEETTTLKAKINLLEKLHQDTENTIKASHDAVYKKLMTKIDEISAEMRKQKEEHKTEIKNLQATKEQWGKTPVKEPMISKVQFTATLKTMIETNRASINKLQERDENTINSIEGLTRRQEEYEEKVQELDYAIERATGEDLQARIREVFNNLRSAASTRPNRNQQPTREPEVHDFASMSMIDHTHHTHHREESRLSSPTPATTRGQEPRTPTSKKMHPPSLSPMKMTDRWQGETP